MRKILLFLLLNCTTLMACFSQTGESPYFYHSQYFNSDTVTRNKISKITVTSFWTRPQGKIYQDNQTVYTYNRSGELICTESYYFKPHEPEIITQQTIDCNEYEKGLLTRHLRYRNNRDSAVWIEEFDYQFDNRGNIIQITKNDLSYPHNSSKEFKDYDKQNRLIKSWTDYDYSTVYSYDKNGNLTKKIWGPNDGPKNKHIYQYDKDGNMMEYRMKGAAFDNYDIVRTIHQYDSLGRKTRTESERVDGARFIKKFFYEDHSIIRSAYYNENMDLLSVTIKTFEDSLIQSVITKRDTVVHSKELFEYEFAK